MSNIENAKSASSSTFVTALVFNAAVFGIEIALFTLIRPYFKSIYEPRTYVPPPPKRVKPLSSSFLGWPIALFKADYRDIKSANGMDAYFFVRFLRLLVKMFLPIWFVSWAVLIPVTYVGNVTPGKDVLDRFTFGNIAPQSQGRYAAHIILVYIFTFWIFYNIKHEMVHFIITRQQYLVTPAHSSSVQANTILVTGIPVKYLTQDALLKLFHDLPGGVKRIWINRNLKELPEIYGRRLKASAKLESAETVLLRTAAKLHLQAEKTAGKSGLSSSDVKSDISKPTPLAKTSHGHAHDSERDTESQSSPDTSIVPADKRPTHRLGFVPFTGKKVDTIEWCRTEIIECTRLLDEGRALISSADERGSADPQPMDGGVETEEDVRETHGEDDFRPEVDQTRQAGDQAHASSNATDTNRRKNVKDDVLGVAKGTMTAMKGRVGMGGKHGEYPPLNSAFVTFNRQIAAHLAVQVLAHHEPYRMSSKYVDVAPQDVIWANLGLNPYEQKVVRMAISYAITAGLIILWAFPVAFVGAISNIHALCQKASWLAWICELPDPVVGIISGILPPVLLAILMMLLPIILRLLARFEGIPKRTGLELSLMTRFFIFQVIHSFLIITLSSGIIASLDDLLSNPTSIPTILAQNLPQASTFFLTFIILQGLAATAGGFLQIVPLVIYYVKLYILGSTPRAVHGIKFGTRNVAWGTTFPGLTLLVVITLGYSMISPLINGLACATFFAFYQLYKYLFLWSYQQPLVSDTGGLFFPKALQHVFVGLYVQQICLCALFFLARNENKKPSSIAEGVLMIILIVITAGFNAIINNSYGPLLRALPLSLADKTYAADVPASNSSHQADGTKSKDPEVDHPTQPGADNNIEATSQAFDVEEHNRAADTQRKQLEEDDYGFSHPAASRPQRTVWLPHDTLGLVEKEMKDCKDMGVEVSDENAVMNEKGKVDVSGSPPDAIAG